MTAKLTPKSYNATIARPLSAFDFRESTQSGSRLLLGIVVADLTQITVGIRSQMF